MLTMKDWLTVAVLAASVMVGAAVLLEWRLGPIYDDLQFIRQHVLAIEGRLTAVERDLNSVVGYCGGNPACRG